MALAAHLRTEVAALAIEYADVMVDVQHKRYLTTNGDNERTYADPVTKQVVLEHKAVPVQWRHGTETVAGDMVTFLENYPVKELDLIILPDGKVAPIAEVRGFPDPDGGVLYAQAILGRPERGVAVST